MRKIKILQVIAGLDVGGIETHLLELAKNINKSRFQISVCCIGNGMLVDEFRRMNIKVIVLNKKPRAMGFDSLKKMIIVMKTCKIDIVHCHNFTAGVRGHIAAKIARVPIVIKSYHGFDPWKKLIILLLDRFFSVFTDNFIVASEARKEVMVEKEMIRPEKVIMVHHGINYDNFDIQINIEEKKVELGLERDKYTVGIIASLTLVKDHRTFLKSAQILIQQFNSVQFLIIGDGVLKKELINYCRELSIESNIHFVGIRRDIPEILPVMHIVVLSSVSEDFPISLLEAMSCRKPIVATKVGGIPEIVVDGETGYLVKPGNPMDMARMILKLLQDRHLSLAMGEKGRIRVEELFSTKREMAKIEKIYSSLFENKMRYQKAQRGG